MFSTNRRCSLIIIIILLMSNIMNAQIHLEAAYGKTFDSNAETPQRYRWNGVYDLKLIYENQNTFNPYFSIGFSRIPLNYSDIIIDNQGGFKTVIVNNSISFELGMESRLKTYYKSDLKAIFGIGINYFSSSNIWLENSNESFGFNSDYEYESNPLFAFVNLAIKIDRSISNQWKINFSLGSEYYPTSNTVIINTQVFSSDIAIESSFSRFRPYAKIGLNYSLTRN